MKKTDLDIVQDDKNKFLSINEVIARLQVTKTHLSNLRMRGKGPTWIKKGGRILYYAESVSNHAGNKAPSSFWTDPPIVLDWKAKALDNNTK